MSPAVFQTARMRAVPAAEADLDGLLAVYLSNPGTLALTEGSAGEPGHYDRGMLERDLWMAELDPQRTAAALELAETGEPVGAMDWIERHPERDIPWLGMLMVHANHHRHGLGWEAVDGLAELGRRRGWTTLGAGSLADDDRAAGFLHACGFEHTGDTPGRLAAGPRTIRLWRRELELLGGVPEHGQVVPGEQHEPHQVDPG
ncbi:MAG: GNAT family N-acetyltransferase [Gaiellales bacterium]